MKAHATAGRSGMVTPHVLFVDDDEPNLIVWEAACSDDFAVLTASSAEAAIDLMRSHEVAVILADQRMPRTTGVELLERVRHEFPNTIRILITAYSDLHAAIDAINRGEVRRYLRKPCEPDELKAELADALDLYRLRQRVAVMERRLLQTERVYALGLAAAGLAHELRNPTTWIKESVDTARRELGSAADRLSERDESSGAVVSQIREIDAILEDAQLGVSRVVDIVRGIELPTKTTSEESVELPEVLRLVLRIVRGELRRSAQIELDTAPVPRVHGTSTKLGQVLLNLVVNALQALSEQAPSESLVTIRLRDVGDRVRLEVMDNGPGLEEDELSCIFDPFYTTKREAGTGLGLAISRRIAEEFGGALTAHNRVEGGAVFRLELPVARGS